MIRITALGVCDNGGDGLAAERLFTSGLNSIHAIANESGEMPRGGSAGEMTLHSHCHRIRVHPCSSVVKPGFPSSDPKPANYLLFLLAAVGISLMLAGIVAPTRPEIILTALRNFS